MDTEEIYKKYENIRKICLDNAEDLIMSAKKLANSNLQHIQYHLAALALEEIGKAELIEMSYVAGLNSRDSSFEESSMENHIKKLFWAFWGSSFGKKVVTKKEIEQLQGLATAIHIRRLSTLYVNISDQYAPKNKLSQKEADEITNLAEARLGMEKGKTMLKPDDPSVNKEELSWFMKATADKEKFTLIFGQKSQSKLIELGNVRDWIHWLKEQFDKNDEEIRKIIEEELHRNKPGGEQAKKPKYRIKIRINSESHSIRAKKLNEWNKNINFIKLFTDNKSDLIIQFLLPASLPLQGLWEVGWGMSRAFTTAINIATKGFFWWHTPKDRSKYYEEVFDLERNMKLDVKMNPELTVNFKDLHWILDEKQLARANYIFYYLTKIKNKKENEPFNYYVTGLTFVAKNDIHFRCELNAFNSFYKAFKSAFMISGDWDGKSDFKEAVHKQFSKMETFDHLDQTILLGEEQENSPTKTTKTPITLTEIFAIKLYCDVYLEIIAKRAVDLWQKEEKTKPER